MIKKDYDVVVVGGGPAGTMAAQHAAKQGVSVALFEKDREIGIPVRCAEGVSKKFLKKYIDIDPQCIASEINKVRFVSPAKQKIDFTTLNPGLVLHRRLFDHFLAEKASEAGAQIFMKSYVHGMDNYDGKSRKIFIKHFDQEFTVNAKVVIAADGVESRIGRFAGIKTFVKPEDIDVCVQATMGNLKNIDPTRIEMWVSNKWAPGGYAWVFPKGPEIANIGLGICGKFTNKPSALSYFKNFIKENFPEGSALTTVAGGVPVAKHLERLVSDGVMLIGDAARQANPLTGGGILSGMAAGMISGKIGAQGVLQSDTSYNYLKEYEQIWKKGIGKEYNRFYRLKNNLLNLSDEKFIKIASEFENLKEEDITITKIVVAAVKNNPKLVKDAMLAFIGF